MEALQIPNNQTIIINTKNNIGDFTWNTVALALLLWNPYFLTLDFSNLSIVWSKVLFLLH